MNIDRLATTVQALSRLGSDGRAWVIYSTLTLVQLERNQNSLNEGALPLHRFHQTHLPAGQRSAAGLLGAAELHGRWLGQRRRREQRREEARQGAVRRRGQVPNVLLAQEDNERSDLRWGQAQRGQLLGRLRRAAHVRERQRVHGGRGRQLRPEEMRHRKRSRRLHLRLRVPGLAVGQHGMSGVRLRGARA